MPRAASTALYAFALSSIVAVTGKTVDESTTTTDTRACQPPHDSYLFCDTSKPLADRVADLVSQLEDSEKPPLLTAREGGGGSPGPPGNVSRLGLPEYDWGVNCIHGVQTSCVRVAATGKVVCPTSFPNPVNMGATFNTSHFSVMGQIIGKELRALWRMGATEESTWSGRPHAGLDCWSPNININRDPRWGRNQEVPSEDPYLNGLFGVGYTRGLQEGPDERYLQAIVTLKHWDAYSLEDADGFTRHNFNAIVSNATLADTYFPAWKASVQEGKAKGIMCSYNAVNGIPTCANAFLSSTLRGWGYDGYITSDTGAINDIFAEHKYVPTGEEASCKAITDGMCHINSGGVYAKHLLAGVKGGHCTMDDVDAALTETLKLRFQLGLFDPIEDQPYWHVPADQVGNSEHAAVSLLSAMESMVLLKNDADTLPLKAGAKWAVIGPHAGARAALAGNYLGQLCDDDTLNCVQSPFEALKAANVGGATTQTPGCALTGTDTSGFTAATQAAAAADHVILVLGIDESIEAESKDRSDIDLPAIQHQLADAIFKVGKPTVVVLINGAMVAIAEEKANAGAILSAGYPGIYGAQAIASSLAGTNTHLGGVLPYTLYPKDYINQVKMSDMEMTAGPGRTYRFYGGTPLYSFGYGLSLTTFTVNSSTPLTPITLSTQASSSSSDMPTYSFVVTNTGTRTGDMVLLNYLVPPAEYTQARGLLKQLIGFQRVHLGPGDSQTVSFDVTREAFALVDPHTGHRTLVAGKFGLEIGQVSDKSVPFVFEVMMEGADVVTEPFPSTP